MPDYPVYGFMHLDVVVPKWLAAGFVAQWLDVIDSMQGRIAKFI